MQEGERGMGENKNLVILFFVNLVLISQTESNHNAVH
jgi:hypothetical protein